MPRLTRALWLGVLLAACAPAPVTTITAFRAPGAPLYSAAAFTPARIAGEWRQVASFTAGDAPGCRAGAVRFQPGPGGVSVSGRLCLNGREVAVSGLAAVTGPGRLSVPGMADWWVIWVDSGYRTLAIGTPKGEFGFVLDRGAISGDRLKAAAEIFDFNGYPKSRLRPF